MTLTNVIEILVALAGLITVAVLWADGIEAEPPATAAERRCWPADVKEDTGEYDE